MTKWSLSSAPPVGPSPNSPFVTMVSAAAEASSSRDDGLGTSAVFVFISLNNSCE